MCLTYRPIKNEKVVVLRGDKVIGTITRYRQWKRCLVSVPGLLTAASNPGKASFPTIPEAKARLNELARCARPRLNATHPTERDDA